MKHTETVSGSLRILNLLLGTNEIFSLWQLFQKAKLVKRKLLLIEKVIYPLIGRSAKKFFF